MAEVQAYTEARVPMVPEVAGLADWERLSARLRREVLERVVLRGEARHWAAGQGRVVWLETIEGGPGYRIRKLRYEAVPGFWIPALLYEPENLAGQVPVSLNVNGHEGIGKSVPYKQIRCINQVRRGMLVLNPEWIGMGQLNGPDYHHGKLNQLDLCGTSGVSLFYLALSRGLDLLLDHPNADPARVAVAGLSGGGWQTIFISALDPRVTLCNPVAGYSSLRTRARFLGDLGDSEQTPCDLATVADYTHLTAMLAPRPALLTYNLRDECCFASGHALEPLWRAAMPAYALYGRPGHLRSHVNHEPGTHNFGEDNRQALYRMLGDHFFAGAAEFSALEIPCETEIKPHTNLLVMLPTNNATFHSLALDLARKLPRQAKLPARRADLKKWQQANRAHLREILRVRPAHASAEEVGRDTADGVQAIYWRIRISNTWTVPVVELTRGQTTGTVILVADGGRAACAEVAAQALSAGQRVLAVDPFYFGESRIRSHDYLFALLLAAIGDRALGLQAGQVAAIARWADGVRQTGPARVIALGPRSSLFALAAAAIEERAIAGVQMQNSLGSLKEILEQNRTVNERPEMFCFGLLETFDLKHLVALVAPRPVDFPGAGDSVRREMADLDGVYRAWGKEWSGLMTNTDR